MRGILIRELRIDIVGVLENPVALLSREFLEDAALEESDNEVVGRGIAGAEQVSNSGYGDKRSLEENFEYAVAVAGGAA